MYCCFAGAAIASMLHARYDKLKQNAANEQLSQETTILEKLSIHNRDEKDHISGNLKYRDKGHMYFPCKDLLPLIKEIDLCTKTSINAEAFKKYGSQLLVILSHKFVQDSKLQQLYRVVLQAKVPEFAQMNENIVDSVFKEFVQKLCHQNSRICGFFQAAICSTQRFYYTGRPKFEGLAVESSCEP